MSWAKQTSSTLNPRQQIISYLKDTGHAQRDQGELAFIWKLRKESPPRVIIHKAWCKLLTQGKQEHSCQSVSSATGQANRTSSEWALHTEKQNGLMVTPFNQGEQPHKTPGFESYPLGTKGICRLNIVLQVGECMAVEYSVHSWKDKYIL